MTEADLINAAIDDGESEVREVYQRPDEQEKRDGALAGFAFCRGKSEAEMRKEIARSNTEAEKLRRENVRNNYWYWRYYTLQIEWVLNVLNGARHITGQGLTGSCTARGALKAARLLGASTDPFDG